MGRIKVLKYKMAREYLKIVYYIFLGAFAAVAVLMIVSIFPVAGNYKIMIVRSGSMEPAIRTGSVVFVKSAEKYRIGDIITFNATNKKGTTITHRIAEMRVETGNPIYITKGDANNSPDSREIRPREIIGKVLLDIPYIGYVVAVVQKPTGFMLIIIPAAIIIFDEARKIIKQIRKTG